jgi:transposase
MVEQGCRAGVVGDLPVKIATVGLANKTARIAWAVMARKEV